MTYIKPLLFLIIIFIAGCSTIDKSLTRALTSSTNVRLEKINRHKAIARYDYGELIEGDGKSGSADMMKEYCSPLDYDVISQTEEQTGERQWMVELNFECIDRSPNHTDEAVE